MKKVILICITLLHSYLLTGGVKQVTKACCGFAKPILLARLAFQAMVIARSERCASILLCLASAFVATCLPLRLIAADVDPKVEELRNFVTATVPTIHGWCSQEKASVFFDLIVNARPEVCVEIGVFGGSSFFPVVSALKFLNHGIAIAVDPWDKLECIKHFDPIKDEAHLNWWGRLNFDQYYYSFLNILRQYELTAHSIVMRTTSEKAASVIGPIDFLYLDGNHTEVMTTKDVQLYLPKVRSGGYICINDTLWPEMQNGVELLLEACDVVQLIDNGNAILFRKR